MTTIEVLPRWALVRQEVIGWRDRYNKEDLHDRTCELQLGSLFRKQGFVSHPQMERLIKWKFHFDPRLIEKELGDLAENRPGLIKKTTTSAFLISDDIDRLRQLCRIKGVGPSVASVILAFFAPQNFGVLDIHAWRELFEPSRKTKDFKEKDFVRTTKVFRYLGRIHGLMAREVEKAIFKKNMELPRRA